MDNPLPVKSLKEMQDNLLLNYRNRNRHLKEECQKARPDSFSAHGNLSYQQGVCDGLSIALDMIDPNRDWSEE